MRLQRLSGTLNVLTANTETHLLTSPSLQATLVTHCSNSDQFTVGAYRYEVSVGTVGPSALTLVPCNPHYNCTLCVSSVTWGDEGELINSVIDWMIEQTHVCAVWWICDCEEMIQVSNDWTTWKHQR